MGYKTQQSYNGDGQLTGVTDAPGNQVKLTYNAADQITQVIDPSNEKISYAYDPNGNIASATG
jgi:YD repeat-containing protein